jgi:hypothetical protein
MVVQSAADAARQRVAKPAQRATLARRVLRKIKKALR